jgi:hypothetical protein
MSKADLIPFFDVGDDVYILSYARRGIDDPLTIIKKKKVKGEYEYGINLGKVAGEKGDGTYYYTRSELAPATVIEENPMFGLRARARKRKHRRSRKRSTKRRRSRKGSTKHRRRSRKRSTKLRRHSHKRSTKRRR